MINDKLILAMNEVQDALSSLNMRAQIDLPQIAVVGSQSSGKSSVLEALVGRDFLPRGSGIVTRCPLVLKLQVGPTSGGDFGEFTHKPNQKFTDFNEIRREIERRTEEIAGPTGITPNPILLTVTSPNVLNLTCVDLPGIVMTATQGQHEGIEKAILEMVINFIRPENTIILAVTPANADMANSVAIRTARIVDPELQRTIGVLTKIDIMDEGTDALDALEGRAIPLKRGWVGVVNRSQKAINENRSMTDARKLEMKFFEEHAVYSKIATKCGTQFLAKTMSEVLMSHIKKSLPELRRKIEDMLADTQKRMEQMGMTDSMNKDNSSTLLALLQQYCSLLRDAIEGRQPPPGAENESLYGGALIDDMLQRRFTEHVTSMKAGARLTDDLLRETTRNAAGIEGTLITSERGFRILAKKQVRTLEDPMLKCVDVVHDELRRLCMLCGAVLARYPTLQTRVQEIMCNAITDFRGPCAAHVRTMVAAEANYVNVKHPKIQDLVMRTDLGPQLPALPTHAPNGQPLTPQQQQQLQLQQLHQLQQQQQQPVTAQQREQTEFAKLRELVETYFTICKATTCDQLPKIINLMLVMKLMTDSDKLLMHALFRDDLFADLLAESPAVARRREGLTKMFQALNKAKGALDHVRDIPLGA